MIFLGAGASKELGIKTMQELTDDVINLLKNRGYKEETKEIIFALKQYAIKPDFEAIFSVIEGLVDVNRGIRQAGPLTAFVSKDLASLAHVPDAGNILNDLKILIYEECSKIKLDKLDEVFNPIFKERPKLQSRNWKNVATRIVTTNYDMAVELYHWKKEMPLFDGFQSTGNPYIRKYTSSIPIIKNNPEGTTYANNNGKLLIKLHGSIWCFKQGNRIIKTITDPKSHNILSESQIGKQLMIYPTKEKPLMREPFYDFFNSFKQQGWDILVVIVYSFRDEPVNTILLEQLKKAKSPNVFVVDPNASEIVKNFDGYEEFASCFHNVNIEFGKEAYAAEFFEAINPYLQNYSY